MRPDTGTIWAADGWRIEWDIRVMPHSIDRHDAAGVPSIYTSGDCSQPYLDREIKRFLREHAEQQMAMEL